MAKSQRKRAGPREGVWHFDDGAWSLGKDPVAGSEGDDRWLDALRDGGYHRYAAIRLEGGRWASDYRVSVYEAVDGDRFLTCLAAKGRTFKMVAENLPSLLELLGKLIPVVRLAAETQDKEYELKRRSEPTEGLP